MIFTLTLNPALDRELIIPKFDFDQVLRASSLQTDFGGKGFNVSRALQSLGIESIALGFIGGFTGDALNSGLTALGIQTDFIRIAGETRINTSIVNEDHSHYLKINTPGPTISPDELARLLEKIRSLARSKDWWVLAGSLPPGVPAAFYREAIQIIQTAGSYAILDCEGAPLREGCSAGVFMIKPNAREAGELTGDHIESLHSACSAIVALHKLGPRRAVISFGGSGAVYSDGLNIWRAEPPEIQEKNPIGAGDAMVAGLIYGMQNHFTNDDVLRWGVASGAAAASLAGTAMGPLELVVKLSRQVRIEAVGPVPQA